MFPILKKILGIQSQSGADLPTELVHINQEMYKKSLELSERNKTLLLLRKIDEIILSSITNQEEIAQHVTSLLIAEGDFQLVSIFKYEKDSLELFRLSRAESGVTEPLKIDTKVKISISNTANLMVQAAIEKSIKIVSKTDDLFLESAQRPDLIKCVFVYPLIAREELIGSMIIALREEEYNITEYSRDLLDRLAQVIGIAMDNALLYNELQDANEKLKALDKLKDEFVSLASHELRTPMTAIKSYLWMTLQGRGGPLTDTQKRYLERAYSSVDRLIKLVNDMLNISRIESGRLTLEMESVNLQKITEEVLNEVIPRAQELGVNIEIAPVNTDLPAVVADSDKIKEVLFNLIGNSLKFTPKDGKITLSFEQKDDMIETKVKDTGAGISEENISKLFQKFTMLPESYKENNTASGTGLGLYISRSIIELHKGHIWVESAGIGQGSEFIFSLKVYGQDSIKEFEKFAVESAKESVGIVHSKV